MKNKNIIMNILARILLITINCFLIAFAYRIIKNEYVFVIINLSVLLTAQIILFIRYFIRLSSDIKLFFEAISSNDSSLLFESRNKQILISNYNEFLQKINNIIQEKNLEIIKQKTLLEGVFENAKVGIITYLNDGKIDSFNTYAEVLLNSKKTDNISKLNKIHIALPTVIKELEPSKNQTLRINFPSKEHPDIIESNVLSFTKSLFSIDDTVINLISFNDIRNELENKEMESWQKLIRVLTHEIMNSISPITSLTKAIQGYLNEIEKSSNIEKNIEKTQTGIKTIESTSNSLLHFVEQYRSLTLLPKPTFTEFKVSCLFDDISTLFKQELLEANIDFQVKEVDQNTSINADFDMLKQVLINLIKNAVFALKETQEPQIGLNYSKNSKNRNIIQITDNGKGVDESIIDKVFIPFFTTKETGTGIGLSLSKQIMRLHSGDIVVKSTPNYSTVFSLIF